MAEDLRALLRRQGQINLLAYLVILALIVVVGILVFALLAELRPPDLWVLRSHIFQTLGVGLVLALILYMADSHGRLRSKVKALHDELEVARGEVLSAYERTIFAHHAAEIACELSNEEAIGALLGEMAEHFGADAAAVVGEDVAVHAPLDEDLEQAETAMMRLSVEAVRGDHPFVVEDPEVGGEVLGVPLRVHGHVKAVCCLWRRSGAFSYDQTEGLALVGRVIELALENRRLLKEAREQLRGVLDVLTMLVEMRRPHYVKRSARIAKRAARVASVLGMEHDAVQDLQLAGLLIDVGMLAVPESALPGGRPLNDEEMELVKQHPEKGAELVRLAGFGAQVQDAVLYHQEHLDGSGYPAGVTGERIPLAARVLAVCDAYESMTTPRAWRDAMSPTEAAAELRRQSDRLYDRRVVQALLGELGLPSPTAYTDPQGRARIA